MHQLSRLAAFALFLGLLTIPAPRAQGAVERLGTDRLPLTGSVSGSDVERIAELLSDPNHEISTLVVCARGVGRKDTFTDRKGVADAPDQYWYYTSTNGSGNWRHATNHDLIRVVDRERDWAERKLTSLRRQANRPARPAKPSK